MSSEALQQFRERAGGRWAVSWQAYVISVPIAFVYALATLLPLGKSESQKLLAVLVAATSCVLVGAWTWFLGSVAFRNRVIQPMSVLQILAGGLSAGIVYWATLEFGIYIFDVNEYFDSLTRLVVSAIVVAWWGTSVSLLLEARDRFAKEREEFIETAIQIEVAAGQSNDLIEKIRRTLELEINSEMFAAREQLLQQIEQVQGEFSVLGWREISESLRSAASDVVRPLSRKLWERAAQSFPAPSFKLVLTNILNYQLLRPFAVTMFFLLTTGSAQIKALDSLSAIRFVMFEVVFIILVMAIANMLMTRFAHLHSKIFLTTILIFQVFDFFAASYFRMAIGESVTVLSTVTDVFASVSIILLTSGFGSLRFTRAGMINTFRANIDAKEIELLAENRHVSALAYSASKMLHGNVQTRLVSCAAAIDRAVIAKDIDSLNSALQEARLAFDAQPFALDFDDSVTVEEAVSTKCGLWHGLCATTMEIDSEVLLLTGRVAQDIASIVEEAISNAVRHGKAQRVWIEISLVDSDDVKITITDDGLGLTAGSPNVGFSLFGKVSINRFNLADGTDGKGSILTAIVPLNC